MIAILRLLCLAIFIALSGFIILAVCLFRPFDPANTYLAARLYSRMQRVLGVRVTISGREYVQHDACCVYLANHQSNYDVFLLTSAVPPRTVCIGKKTLIFLPFFGLIYWLGGNIFIERHKTDEAIKTLQATEKKMLDQRLSLWVFPEGHRSLGKGILPFKTGAFHLARNISAPIVPICVSAYYDGFHLNRLNNGEVHIRYLPPVTAHLDAESNLREVTEQVRAQMTQCVQQMGNLITP